MFDLTQVMLVVVIVILTTIMAAVGIQIILLLRDIRRLFGRVNGLIDRAEMTMSSWSGQFAGLSSLVEGIRSGVGVVEKISQVLGRKEKTSEVEDYVESMDHEHF